MATHLSPFIIQTRCFCVSHTPFRRPSKSWMFLTSPTCLTFYNTLPAINRCYPGSTLSSLSLSRVALTLLSQKHELPWKLHSFPETFRQIHREYWTHICVTVETWSVTCLDSNSNWYIGYLGKHQQGVSANPFEDILQRLQKTFWSYLTRKESSATRWLLIFSYAQICISSYGEPVLTVASHSLFLASWSET